MSFIEAFAKLRICRLFRYVFCHGILRNLLFSYGFSTTIVSNGLREPYLLLTNSSFPLLLYESQGMFNLDLISQNSEIKI